MTDTLTKTIALKFVGGARPTQALAIVPGNTPREVLSQLSLGPGFQLGDARNEIVYDLDDPLYPRIDDGDLLHVTSMVDAGGWWGKSAAPAPRRVALPTGLATVAHDRRSLLQRRGWTRTGRQYRGQFANRFGTWAGRIEDATDRVRVFIKNPPACIARHPKHACFIPLDGGWYQIHLNHSPADRDPNAVIAYVERILTEAFRSGARA